VTTNEILVGLGLIAALAVGSQVLASRLRIPALIVLLPVGFAAGALTSDVNPDKERDRQDLLRAVDVRGRQGRPERRRGGGGDDPARGPEAQPTAAAAARIPRHPAATATVPPQAPAEQPATSAAPPASSPDTGTWQQRTR
jgi:hypothetical protein